MLVALIVAALAVAFLISAIERWIDLSWVRGVVALAGSAVAVFMLDHRGTEALLLAMASAFVALMLVLAGERLATPPPILLERNRNVL